jgi:glutaredoxin
MLSRTSRRVAAFLLLLLPFLCAQAQYKWIDAKGRVNYGDQPPRDARRVERIEANTATAGAGVDELAGLPFDVRRAAKNFPVVLYVAARPDCAPCSDARNFLKAHAVPFVERIIATDKDRTAFEALGGGTQVPAVTIGRDWLRGFEPAAWAEAIHSAGYPQGVELPRTWQWPAAAPLVPPEPTPPTAAAPGETN